MGYSIKKHLHGQNSTDKNDNKKPKQLLRFFLVY